MPENSPAGTNVGAPVTATDTDSGDTLTYTLECTDATSFDIVSTSGRIRTTTGVTYDHEAQSSYSVTVKADDGNGGSDTIAVTITLTNVSEPPSRPAAPSVASSTTSLSVMWTAPSNTGPAVDTYDLEYRQGTSGSWITGPQNVSGTSATITGLTANTSYQVQVLATNADGDSPWSPSGSGRTNTAGNSAPTFANPTETRSVAENSAAGTNVGAPVTATDSDSGDTLTYTLEGTNSASFEIVSTSGQIRTRSGVTYTQSTYAVIVKADDGNGGSATVAVTITVTVVTEPPPVNAAPLAVDDAAETAEDTPVTIAVLANDSDPDGDTLTVVEVSAPAHGTARLTDAGTVEYTPEPDFHGIDRFTYVVDDGTGETARATVEVTVQPVNDPPQALDDSADTPEDTPVTIAVLANDSHADGDPLTVVEVSAPAQVPRIFKAMAKRAGVSGAVVQHISGHSTRVGAAQDMVASGIGMAAILHAGRWKTTTMVNRYGERLLARLQQREEVRGMAPCVFKSLRKNRIAARRFRPQQKPWRRVPRERVADLLGCPRGRGVPRHVDMQDLASIMGQAPRRQRAAET